MAYRSGSNPFGFSVTPWVKRLLIANGVAFLILLAFRGLLPYVWFEPAALLVRPWTVITYMFVHGDVFHVLFNLLTLFFFGPVLEDRWGGREFVKFYLVSGLGAAALSFIFPYTPIIGASGAVFGLMVAFALYWPDVPIHIWGIFPVKAKWLVGGLVAINLLSAYSGRGGSVAHLAHLGGALAAFLYLKSPLAPPAWGELPKKRKPSPLRIRRSWFSRRAQPEPATASPLVRDVHRSYDEVDRILDKISQGGMESLTEEERRRLEEASRKFRSN